MCIANEVIQLNCCSFKSVWLNWYHLISFYDHSDSKLPNPKFLRKMFCDVMEQFDVSVQPDENALKHEIWKNLIDIHNSLPKDGWSAKAVMESLHTTNVTAAKTYNGLRFSVISYALVERVHTKNILSKFIPFETVLELLKYSGIKLITFLAKKEIFEGDMHICLLYCWWCNEAFGPDADITALVQWVPLLILTHHGICPESPDSDSVVCPPFFII